jgi:RloB-like protein
MLSRSRLYSKKEPDKDARLYIIFSEGSKTEPNYFRYFNGITSQVKIEVIGSEYGRTSPAELYDAACRILLPGSENPNPKYQLADEDEIWFVFDTDDWGSVIPDIRSKICQQKNWFVAQSNPCFEVWHMSHFEEGKHSFEGMEVSRAWKQHVHNRIGGFNCNKHPIYVERAIGHAKKHFSSKDGLPDIACTEVFLLMENIFPLVKTEIDVALKLIEGK